LAAEEPGENKNKKKKKLHIIWVCRAELNAVKSTPALKVLA
jgi:hypothetical protein